MAKVQYGDGSFQSQTQSPSPSRVTRRSSVAASVVWEALKQKGAFQSQTQSPSPSRATRRSSVAASVVWEALKRKGAQRGFPKAASLSRLCCRSKIPIRNRRTSSKHFADHILGIRRSFFFHHLHVIQSQS